MADTEVETISVATGKCMCCGEGGSVVVPKAEWEKWDKGNGPFIQVAMPSVSADIREQILTGTHPACWDAMWADMEVETED